MNELRRFAATALVISVAGLTAVKHYEGYKEVAYLDAVGVPTVCSGSTQGVKYPSTATPAECRERLIQDTSYAGKAVQRCTTATVTQGQYDALVSLAFNVGGSAYCKSTLVKKLNAGKCNEAANEFLRWNRAGGRVLPGLVTRRAAEREQFSLGCV